MSTFRQIVLGSLLFCFVLTLQAQDPVFSQFYSAPLQLNPAFAGTTYAPRISLIYRNQWSVFEGGFQTYAASYEQSVERLNSGFGVSVESDNQTVNLFLKEPNNGFLEFPFDHDIILFLFLGQIISE